MPVELSIVESVTELETTVVTVVLDSSSAPGVAGPGVPTGGTDGQVLTKTSATDYATAWEDPTGGGGGAPDDVDYLVGTASGDLSAEIVVGTSPGGELGGTWASPTVDTTHSGSSHAAVQAAAEATAAAALSSHESDQTNVHGIADTTALALTANHPSNATFNDHSARHENGGADEISIAGLDGTSTELAAHLADSADAHDASAISIADAGNDFTATDVEGALAELQSDHEADATALTDHAADTTSIHGIADTSALALTANHPSNATFNDHSARHENGGADEISIAGLDGTPTELTNHLNDTSAAHAASAISADSTTLVGTGTDVQAVLEELDNSIADHLADTADAHDASAISVLDTNGDYTATDVEGVLAEIAPQLGGGMQILFDSTLGGDAASIDTGANGIAGGYNVLEIWIITRTAVVAVGSSILVTLNNDTGNNYDQVSIQDLNATLTGSNSLAQAQWTLVSFGANAQAGAATTIRMTIPGYDQTTFHKMGEVLCAQVEDTAADARMVVNGVRWRNTAAITRMKIAGNTGDLKAGSRLLIYGR